MKMKTQKANKGSVKTIEFENVKVDTEMDPQNDDILWISLILVAAAIALFVVNGLTIIVVRYACCNDKRDSTEIPSTSSDFEIVEVELVEDDMTVSSELTDHEREIMRSHGMDDSHPIRYDGPENMYV